MINKAPNKQYSSLCQIYARICLLETSRKQLAKQRLQHKHHFRTKSRIRLSYIRPLHTGNMNKLEGVQKSAAQYVHNN